MDYSRAVRAPCGAVVSDETSVDRTVSIEADNDSKVLDILQALLLKVGANTLAGVQPRGKGLYDVAFHTATAYQDALAWNLAQDQSCLRAVSASNGLTRVRVLGISMHWKWAPLLDVLTEYGEVKKHFYETFQGYPTIRNGTRVVLMKLDKGKVLGDSIQVERMTVRLEYPGVARSCFYCRKTGHMVRDCPKKALLVETSVSLETPATGNVPMEARAVPPLVPVEEPEFRGLKRKEKEVSVVTPDEPYLSPGEIDPAMDFDELVIAEPDLVRAPSYEPWCNQMDAAVPLPSSDLGTLVPAASGSSSSPRPEPHRFRKKELKNSKSARTSSPSPSPSRDPRRPSKSKDRSK